MSGDGERIDQQSQQNAKEFMRSLSQVLEDLVEWIGDEKGEWVSLFSGGKEGSKDKKSEIKDKKSEIKVGDTGIRLGGGSPAMPSKEVIRMDFSNGKKAYFSRDPSGKKELVLPNMPVNYIPEFLGTLLTSLKGEKLQDGVKFHYKPAGQRGYTPVLMERQSRLSLANPLPAETVQVVEGVCKQLSKALREALDALEKLGGVDKSQESRHGFIESVGSICNRVRASAGKFCETTVNAANQLRDKAQNWALASELYTLATKLDNPKEPGRLHGHSYSILTEGPGRVSILNNEGKSIFVISKRSLWAKPEITVAEGVSRKELDAIHSRISYINEKLGDKGLTKFLEGTPPRDTVHIFEGFTPPAIMSQFLSLSVKPFELMVTEVSKPDPVASVAQAAEIKDGIEPGE
jgi:hypothetical protein